jgi:hypothetical protein
MRALCALFVLFTLPLRADSSGDAAVLKWREELAARGAQVYIARVALDRQTNTLRLPADTPERASFAAYLKQDEFVRQLLAAQALTVSARDGNGTRNYIFLNMSRASDWEGHEDAILAHELGHVWLRALGYPSPVYQGGQTACLSIHAGDVVQHVLIRRETQRRGIDYAAQSIRALEQAMHDYVPSSTLEPCAAVQEAALWVDVRLGLSQARWPRLPEFESFMRRNFAALESTVDDLAIYLKPLDLEDKNVHRQALRYSFERFRTLALSLLKTNK